MATVLIVLVFFTICCCVGGVLQQLLDVARAAAFRREVARNARYVARQDSMRRHPSSRSRTTPRRLEGPHT